MNLSFENQSYPRPAIINCEPGPYPSLTNGLCLSEQTDLLFARLDTSSSLLETSIDFIDFLLRDLRPTIPGSPAPHRESAAPFRGSADQIPETTTQVKRSKQYPQRGAA